MPSFNLVDEPWIPCVPVDRGAGALGLVELGLREALLRAAEIREVVDPSPLVTVGLHRLLLALTHRVVRGPRDADEWRELWEAKRFAAADVEGYLGKWRQRFDLFDERRPFCQTAALTDDRDRAKPVAELAHELASGRNASTLFDHTLEASMPPARAARYLVALHSFAVGGWLAFRRGEDPQQHKSAKASPLAKCAVALVRGASLFETLLLNLHRYCRHRSDRDQDEPFRLEADDCPAWERDDDTQSGDRWPRGYLDLLTWQSRRARLYPDVDAAGTVAVRQVAVMKGWQFPSDFHQRGRETMLAFVKRQKAAKGQDPWPALAFREDRALWRDSLALLEAVPEVRARPKVVGWLHELADAGVLTWAQTVPLDLLGMTTDQAKVLLWRHERLALPLAYLDDRRPELRTRLGEALRLAEEVAGKLDWAVWTLARLVVAPLSDQPGARQPDRGVVRSAAERLDPGRAYWSQLEVPFRHLLADVPGDVTEADGVRAYGERCVPDWARTLRRAARAAFATSADGLELAPRTVRAVARAERELRIGLAAALKEWLAPEPAPGGSGAPGGMAAPTAGSPDGEADEREEDER